MGCPSLCAKYRVLKSDSSIRVLFVKSCVLLVKRENTHTKNNPKSCVLLAKRENTSTYNYV